MKKIYKININYSLFVNNNMQLCSIISCIDETMIKLLEEREKASYLGKYENLKDITKISLLNNQIKQYLENLNFPSYLIFVLEKEDKYNGDYVYIKEIFSGRSFKVDATLLSDTKINVILANIELFKYSLEEINSIKNIMSNIDFDIEEHSYMDDYICKKRTKIIKFPNK